MIPEDEQKILERPRRGLVGYQQSMRRPHYEAKVIVST